MRVFALIVGLLAVAFGGTCIVLTGGVDPSAMLLGWIPLLFGIVLILAFARNPREGTFPRWASVIAFVALTGLLLFGGFLIVLIVGLSGI